MRLPSAVTILGTFGVVIPGRPQVGSFLLRHVAVPDHPADELRLETPDVVSEVVDLDALLQK